MTYRDWKAVYIDKSIPVVKTNDYNDIAVARTEKDFLKFANEVKPEIERYSGRESKWSGKILLANENDKSGGKLWNQYNNRPHRTLSLELSPQFQ